jgi:pimeloyl-ACP methyl ester carboxylesterase
MDGLDSPYAKTTYYRDLSNGLRAAGWSTLRYNKVGVHDNEIDNGEYAATDFAVLAGQLQNLWRLLPAERPRIVFAWSEGTLHVRALPIGEIDAVVLLGGVATNIGDIIQAQGGPPSDELRRDLAGKDRREMLGIDRPVGRLVDELAFEDNWKVFLNVQSLPLLILHGSQDQEVPVAQVKIWENRLPRNRITIVVGRGYDHRFMPQGEYVPMLVVQKVTTWLDELFPIANNR